MKEKVKGTHKNNGNHGGGVFAWGGKACGKAQRSTKRSLFQRKTEGGSENGLVNPWSGNRITKKAYAGRGPETKWEIPDNMKYMEILDPQPFTPMLCQAYSPHQI
jgi:hypothetical protein